LGDKLRTIFEIEDGVFFILLLLLLLVIKGAVGSERAVRLEGALDFFSVAAAGGVLDFFLVAAALRAGDLLGTEAAGCPA